MNIRPLPLKRPDIAELLHVERLTLGDSDLSVDEALTVLCSPAHACWGAWEDGSLVGFLSCFETYSAAGPRLELDMLGVLPAQRGKGLATALIGAALAQAHEANLTAARALVRSDNLASLTAFQRAGLAVTDEVHMLIWDRSSHAAHPNPSPQVQRRARQDPQRPYLTAIHAALGNASALALPVETLAYRGWWIEELGGSGARERAALATALGRLALADQRHEAGLLLPVADAATRTALLAAGWQEAGQFYSLGWSP